MGLGSALYEGVVTHQRLSGPAHQFTYPIYMHLLDLDELGELDRRLRLFGYNRARAVSFRDADHLGDPARSVTDNLRAWLEGQGVGWPGGAVRLLTHCRVLGYVFNPVSFFYCHDREGHLAAIVAEVNNTFGERHPYLLRAGEALPEDGQRPAGQAHLCEWREKKVFHVSPFFSLDGTYRFLMAPPGERVRARIDLTVEGRTVFTSALALERRALDDRALASMLVRYPMVTARVFAAIHWQAFKLWRKKAPFWSKPPYDPEAARGGTA